MSGNRLIQPEFLLWEMLKVPGRGGRRQLVDRQRGAAIPIQAEVVKAIRSGHLGFGKRFRIEWKDLETKQVLTASMVASPPLPIGQTEQGAMLHNDLAEMRGVEMPVANAGARRSHLELENEQLRERLRVTETSLLEALRQNAALQGTMHERESALQSELEWIARMRKADATSARQSAEFQLVRHGGELERVKTELGLIRAERDGLCSHCAFLTSELARLSASVRAADQKGRAIAVGVGAAGVVAGVAGALLYQHVNAENLNERSVVGGARGAETTEMQPQSRSADP